MGLFGDILSPTTWATGQLFGSKAKDAFSKYSDPLGLFGGGEQEVSPGSTYDVSEWTKIGKDLNQGKLQLDKEGLMQTSQSGLANARNNLAMKGGLSAGADERLAKDNMTGFQNAYGGLATRYGLGGAEIEKQGLEKKWEQLANNDRAAAIQRAGKGGGLLGGLLGGILG